MSVKKSILYFLSLIYAIILLHNLTPHVHGSDNKSTSGLLSEWFQLLFGKEHSETQDNRHLSTFSIQDQDEIGLEQGIDITDPEFIGYDFPNLSGAAEKIIFSNFENAGCKHSEKLLSDADLSTSSGRAPPIFAENL